MAKSLKIKGVIKSTQKTAVITQAMQLVAASKLPNALKRLEQAKPFSDLAEDMMAHYSRHSRHRYFTHSNKTKHSGIIIVSTDRGLCGSLNLNLFKQVLQKIKALKASGHTISLSLCGDKAISFFSKHAKVLSQTHNIGDRPELKDLMELIHPMINEFEKGKLDAVYLANSQFVNTLSQKANIQMLLPKTATNGVVSDDYIYEPNKDRIIDKLFRQYIESFVYRSVIESLACEHASRMIAMKNATENAQEIIADLKLTYNKVRQALITQEIAEISAGANYSDGEQL